MTPNEKVASVAARFKTDPLGFTKFAFPWGQEGTELAKADGPRQWQCDVLEDLGVNRRRSGTPLRIRKRGKTPGSGSYAG
jgi:hypothetical protein